MMMRPIHGIAVGLLLAASPAFAEDAEAPKAETLKAEAPQSEKLQARLTATPPAAAPQGLAETTETDAKAPEADAAEVTAPPSPTDPIRLAVQTRLSEKFKATSAQKRKGKGALVEYYSAPDRKLLWVDENGLTTRGKAVMAEVGRADDYGLRTSDYKLPDLAGFEAGAPDATRTLAEAEIAISHAVLDYVHDARGGRITPSRLSKNLDPTLTIPEPLQVIESITFRSDPAGYLRSFHPQHPQFERLRQKLIELRGGGSQSSQAEPPKVRIPNGPLLRAGVVDPQVALLRTRLDVPAGDNPELFDGALADAVRRFQAEHNTATDGVVGPGTRRLLNNPHLRDMGNPAQIDKILLNMERWRWLPLDKGGFHVTVNIPEFMLRVVKDDETVHSTPVIVGKARTQTPVFSDEMKTVVFGPYWNVPNSIKMEEIRPYVRPAGGWFSAGRWNTAVFQRYDLRIKQGGRELDPARVDWNRVDIRKLHLYQPPGPRNVLGQVKFMFPNKHAVYMHDTPQKHLFAKDVRAESHGCMRVQDPDVFASVLLSHDKNWSMAQTKAAFNSSYNRHVALNRYIPVHMTYFTLWVNDDGSLTTFRDLYGHDRRMKTALLGGPSFAEADDGIVTQSVPRRQRVTSRDPFQRLMDF